MGLLKTTWYLSRRAILGEFEFENGPRGIGMVTVDPWAATLLFVAFIIVVNMLLVCVTCLPARHGHLLILARYHS
jgi:hypothetical protein